MSKSELMKKLLILTQLAASVIHFRGTLVREVLRRGHAVVVCAPKPRRAEVEQTLADWGVTFRTLPMKSGGVDPLGDVRAVYALARMLRQERPDLVLTYSMKPIIVGGALAGWSRVPTIVALVTGLGHAFAEQDSGGSGLVHAALRRLLRFSLSYATCTVFQNPDDMRMFRELGMIEANARAMLVGGSGVDLAEYPWSAPVSSPVTFVMVGRLLRDKGVEEFAAAAASLRRRHEFRAVLVGPIVDGPRGIGRKELDRWRAENILEYVGPVDDVRPYLNDSSAFVLPSYYREGVPRSILEAMAVGRPIITTDTPGCRETVRDGKNGYLVRPRDASDLASAMERLIRQPELLIPMGRHSRSIAEERFDVRQVTAAMLAALGIDDVTERPKCRRA